MAFLDDVIKEFYSDYKEHIKSNPGNFVIISESFPLNSLIRFYTKKEEVDKVVGDFKKNNIKFFTDKLPKKTHLQGHYTDVSEDQLRLILTHYLPQEHPEFCIYSLEDKDTKTRLVYGNIHEHYENGRGHWTVVQSAICPVCPASYLIKPPREKLKDFKLTKIGKLIKV